MKSELKFELNIQSYFQNAQRSLNRQILRKKKSCQNCRQAEERWTLYTENVQKISPFEGFFLEKIGFPSRKSDGIFGAKKFILYLLN